MKPEYEEFLTQLCEERRKRYVESCQADLTRADLVRAACNEFTQKFVERFPHLKRVAGFYGDGRGERPGTEHWWCVDTDGTIVDPTAEQFRPGGTYTVLDREKHLVKVGRCINCGWDIFGTMSSGPRSICSEEECREWAMAEYGGM